MRKLFYAFNFGLLGLFLYTVAADHFTEWRKYQGKYYAMTAAELEKKLAAEQDPEKREKLKAEIRSWTWRFTDVKQIITPDLGRVDRCITCHVGMDEFTNPTLANSFTENPYKGHPDVPGLVKKHPFQKFGCTTCHQGQGLATTSQAAHKGIEVHVGESILAEKHLLKQPFIQASCAKCHGDFEKLPGAEIAAKGKQLFERHGCYGCHSINGWGGTVSVDLGNIADKPSERIAAHDYHLAKMEELSPDYHDISVQNWILAHLKRDPAEFVRNDPEGKFNKEPIAPSGMPPFYKDFKEGDAEAITTYLLSMNHEERIPKDYFVYAPKKETPRPASATERGKLVFKKYGCAGCHGIDAKEGRRNFNARGEGQDAANAGSFEEMAKGRCTTLPKVTGTYTKDELKAKIQTGVSAAAISKFNADGPTPSVFMPVWKEKIKGEELDDLATYLLSIAEKSEDGW